MQVVATRAQPTLEYAVTGVDRAPRRVTVFTGTVEVVPDDAGRRFRVLTSDPNGVPISFHVGDPRPFPVAGTTLVAETWIARMPLSTSAEDTVRYGVTAVAPGLAPTPGDPATGTPYVHGVLFGSDLTLTLNYRLTVLSPG